MMNMFSRNSTAAEQNSSDVDLGEEERKKIFRWMEVFWPYQEDFRFEAPGDFTVWDRMPDGTYLASGVSVTVNAPAAEGAPETWTSPLKSKKPPLFVQIKACFEPLIANYFRKIVKRRKVEMIPRPGGTKLVEFPEEVFVDGLALRDLNLTGNMIETIPAEVFEKLSRLTALNLDNNVLTDLPSTIQIATSLTSLSLAGNKIAKLPEEINKLCKVHTLDVRDNLLKEVLFGIGMMLALENLDMSNNRIEVVAETVALVPLRYLNLSGNRIPSLHQNIGQLGSFMQELFLHKNELQFIPWEFKLMARAKSITLYQNALVFLPEDIGSLRCIDRLEVQFNNIRKLPMSMGKMRSLTLLSVNNNGLDRIPEVVCKLINLTQLNLQCNRLSKLPDGMHRLTKLKELTAFNNKISNLPYLGSLVNLGTLSLNSNQLTAIDLDIGLQDLESLTWLDLDDNMFLSADLHPTIKAIFGRLKRVLPVSAMTLLNPDEQPAHPQDELPTLTRVESYDPTIQDLVEEKESSRIGTALSRPSTSKGMGSRKDLDNVESPPKSWLSTRAFDGDHDESSDDEEDEESDGDDYSFHGMEGEENAQGQEDTTPKSEPAKSRSWFSSFGRSLRSSKGDVGVKGSRKNLPDRASRMVEPAPGFAYAMGKSVPNAALLYNLPPNVPPNPYAKHSATMKNMLSGMNGGTLEGMGSVARRRSSTEMSDSRMRRSSLRVMLDQPTSVTLPGSSDSPLGAPPTRRLSMMMSSHTLDADGSASRGHKALQGSRRNSLISPTSSQGFGGSFPRQQILRTAQNQASSFVGSDDASRRRRSVELL